MSRHNDGLDPSSTTDAYGGGSQGYGSSGTRGNDGLDTSRITDAYSGGNSGYGGSATRGNDGLDPSSTTDAYESRSSGYGDSGTRHTDGIDPSSTSDAYGSSGGQRRDDNRSDYGASNASRLDRAAGGNYDDPSYGERTSGGLGSDDTVGTNERTGGVNRGGDQETSCYTSGGLGENDTYGDQNQTGGVDTGHDHNYGMGSGRTRDQEEGGLLPTESGRTDKRDDDDFSREEQRGSSQKQDSTAGKLMEKAGSMFGNEKMVEKGRRKRNEASGYGGGDDNY